jgi:hypothetical protein
LTALRVVPWPPMPLDLGHIGDVPVLHCGLPAGRSAIRVPKTFGMRAYAYLRWSAHHRLHPPLGGVLLDRRSQQIYFLIPTPPPHDAARIAACLEHAPGGVRLLTDGASVVLPMMGSRVITWLHHNPEPTDAFSVFGALRVAGRVTTTGVTLRTAVCLEFLATFSRALQAAR